MNVKVEIQITYLPSGKVESISVTSPTGDTLTANKKYKAVYSDKFRQLWDRLVAVRPYMLTIAQDTFPTALTVEEMELFRANVESTQNGIGYKKGYRIGY